MKKIYLQPETAVEQMVAEQMIAASVTLPIDTETIIDPVDADSRLFDMLGLSFNPFE
ncbi:MAG: hypothetical protein IKR31_08005 [Prevotella sp.]|jgi:hypothetical protein|nr:hypothetical protein [Prevotella sp.]